MTPTERTKRECPRCFADVKVVKSVTISKSHTQTVRFQHVRCDLCLLRGYMTTREEIEWRFDDPAAI